MAPEEVQALCARWTASLNRHDTEDLTSNYAEDCVVESPLFGRIIGHEALRMSWNSIWSAFPDLTIEVSNPLIAGDQVVLTFLSHGTDTGGFLGQDPTRKPYRLLAVFLFTLRDNRIIHERRFYDSGGWLLQLAGQDYTVEGAQLYHATLSRALLERELSMASEIQQALLPPSRHEANGYEIAAASVPCRTIGGDFFDYFDLPDGRFAFVLGDVAGKGPPAALLAGVIQGIFASRAQLGGEPAETLAHVNNVLVRRAIESRFATVVYGILSDGRLTYCNAGHNPPLLIGHKGPQRLDKGGPVIGMFKDTSFEQETVQLHEGDQLIVFSDGITDAANHQGVDFGEDRLLNCIKDRSNLTPPDMLQNILNDVRQFCSGAPQNDDLTALVLRYSGTCN